MVAGQSAEQLIQSLCIIIENLRDDVSIFSSFLTSQDDTIVYQNVMIRTLHGLADLVQSALGLAPVPTALDVNKVLVARYSGTTGSSTWEHRPRFLGSTFNETMGFFPSGSSNNIIVVNSDGTGLSDTTSSLFVKSFFIGGHTFNTGDFINISAIQGSGDSQTITLGTTAEVGAVRPAASGETERGKVVTVIQDSGLDNTYANRHYAGIYDLPGATSVFAYDNDSHSWSSGLENRLLQFKGINPGTDDNTRPQPITISDLVLQSFGNNTPTDNYNVFLNIDNTDPASPVYTFNTRQHTDVMQDARLPDLPIDDYDANNDSDRDADINNNIDDNGDVEGFTAVEVAQQEGKAVVVVPVQPTLPAGDSQGDGDASNNAPAPVAMEFEYVTAYTGGLTAIPDYDRENNTWGSENHESFIRFQYAVNPAYGEDTDTSDDVMIDGVTVKVDDDGNSQYILDENPSYDASDDTDASDDGTFGNVDDSGNYQYRIRTEPMTITRSQALIDNFATIPTVQSGRENHVAMNISNVGGVPNYGLKSVSFPALPSGATIDSPIKRANQEYRSITLSVANDGSASLWHSAYTGGLHRIGSYNSNFDDYSVDHADTTSIGGTEIAYGDLVVIERYTRDVSVDASRTARGRPQFIKRSQFLQDYITDNFVHLPGQALVPFYTNETGARSGYSKTNIEGLEVRHVGGLAHVADVGTNFVYDELENTYPLARVDGTNLATNNKLVQFKAIDNGGTPSTTLTRPTLVNADELLASLINGARSNADDGKVMVLSYVDAPSNDPDGRTNKITRVNLIAPADLVTSGGGGGGGTDAFYGFRFVDNRIEVISGPTTYNTSDYDTYTILQQGASFTNNEGNLAITLPS